MILPFKPRFVKLILDGTKIHTIREDKHNRWKPGRQIQFATGVRTKDYNCFKEGLCLGVQRIFITYAFNDMLEVTIGNRYLSDFSEIEKLAINDGFESYQRFFEWFYPIIRLSDEKAFSGKIIHWTDLKY